MVLSTSPTPDRPPAILGRVLPEHRALRFPGDAAPDLPSLQSKLVTVIESDPVQVRALLFTQIPHGWVYAYANEEGRLSWRGIIAGQVREFGRDQLEGLSPLFFQRASSERLWLRAQALLRLYDIRVGGLGLEFTLREATLSVRCQTASMEVLHPPEILRIWAANGTDLGTRAPPKNRQIAALATVESVMQHWSIMGLWFQGRKLEEGNFLAEYGVGQGSLLELGSFCIATEASFESFRFVDFGEARLLRPFFHTWQSGLTVSGRCGQCAQHQEVALGFGIYAMASQLYGTDCPSCGETLPILTGCTFFDCRYQVRGKMADQQQELVRDWQQPPEGKGMVYRSLSHCIWEWLEVRVEPLHPAPRVGEGAQPLLKRTKPSAHASGGGS